MTGVDPASTPLDGPTPRLADQLCFAVHAASRALDGLYRVLLKDAGITYPQYLVLMVLRERGEISVKGLGETLRLDSGTLSPLLKRLEAAGLVLRRRSSEDERSVIVRMTDEGAAVRDTLNAMPDDVATAMGMSMTEVAQLRGRLNDMTSSLDKYIKAL